MSAATSEDLPPVAVLIVEDRAYTAERLSQLLLLWGAASAHVLLELDEVAAHFAHHPEPTIVLLDHALRRNTSVKIALWLAARPALRARLRVAAYTNSDEAELIERLRTTVAELARDSTLADELLGHPGTADRGAIEPLVQAAHVSDHDLKRLYGRVYDGYLSKRLGMSEVRQALRSLALKLVPGS